MTKREYYDLLIESALNGNLPCLNTEGECMYRGPNGKKCAVGLLVPDEYYTRDMEFKQVVNLPEKEGWLPPWITVGELDVIQMSHDKYAFTLVDGKEKWSPELFVTQIKAMPLFAEFQ